MSKLIVETHKDPAGPTIALHGELIGPELMPFQRACMAVLRAPGAADLTIDMAGVHYIDSLSIGRLVALGGEAEKVGRRLALKNCQPRVRDTLKMMKIDTLLSLR